MRKLPRHRRLFQQQLKNQITRDVKLLRAGRLFYPPEQLALKQLNARVMRFVVHPWVMKYAMKQGEIWANSVPRDISASDGSFRISWRRSYDVN